LPKLNQPFACKFLQATADFAILQRVGFRSLVFGLRLKTGAKAEDQKPKTEFCESKIVTNGKQRLLQHSRRQKGREGG
jgi:hypothetical protein